MHNIVYMEEQRYAHRAVNHGRKQAATRNMLSTTAQGVMGGEENKQMGVGQDWVCCDVEEESGGEEGEVIWTIRPKSSMEND